MSSPHAYSIFSPNPNNGMPLASSPPVFKRCVQCESSAPPCPKCDKGYSCTMVSQSCSACASTKCIRTSSSSSGSGGHSSSGGGTNVGAIAGGVVGGVAFMVIVTFLIWWFFVRKRRNDQSQEFSENQDQGQEKGGNATTAATTTSASTGSLPQQGRNSIASTVLTRASNVIPIAYIPGVTNRSPQGTPDGLVPPVPPLPGASPEQHFFVPGDLRGSAWSDTSGLTSGQTSVADTSRSSVATTVYRNDAIVDPVPAQQAMRTRAAVVSIHGNNTPTSTPSLKVTPADAPAVPTITKAQLAKAGATEINSSPVVARQAVARPVTVTRSASRKAAASEPDSSSSSAPSSSGKSSQSQQKSLSNANGDNTGASTTTAAAAANASTSSPSIGPSPFEDQHETPNEETADKQKRASTKENRKSQLVENGNSPFSDANEVK